MASLREAINAGRATGTLAPWRRIAVEQPAWIEAARGIAHGEGDLVALWSDGRDVHMAVRTGATQPVVLSLSAADGHFHSLGAIHSPAQRPERAIADLYGLVARGADDLRPWIDHGVWGVAQPGREPKSAEVAAFAYDFLPAEGAPLHVIPVGPVHAGIIEPGHFRFSANGETVVRLEERLGYVHRGVELAMRGADLDRAAKLAARVSGDSTVAYSLAFARSVEAALGVEAPARAILLRGLMAELERIANHLGDIGAVCNDAAFAIMQAHCAVLREQVLRAAHACFGHRLMMDRIVPGGVTVDLAPDGAARIEDALGAIDAAFPTLLAIYESTASLQDRMVGTGRVSAELVRKYAAGGYVGRASGRDFDARRALPYAPYDSLAFDVVVHEQGDVDARVRVRMDEVAQSRRLVRDIIARLQPGALRVDLPRADGDAREGAAIVEGFRGDIFVWTRIGADGRIAACHLRDPSWFQWPLLEAAIEGNIVADFPLCNKSFNCSYAGHDL